MTFTQLDDALMDSPEVLSVTRSARLLLMEAYTYCNRQLTDGFITRAQWLRSTDTEELDAEVEALLGAGIIAAEGKGYRLDWSKQQTREQVLKGRERKRADNERRLKSLDLHKSGDHSLCTHAGGGHHKGVSSTGPSSGPSTGRSKGNKRPSDRPVDRPQDSPPDRPVDRLMELPHPTPSQPTPTHSGTEGWVGGDGDLDGTASAGAPATLDAGAAEAPRRGRRETESERWARVDAIIAREFPDTMEDPESLGGLLDAASAAGTR